MRGFVFRPRVHRPAAARASRRPPCACAASASLPRTRAGTSRAAKRRCRSRTPAGACAAAAVEQMQRRIAAQQPEWPHVRREIEPLEQFAQLVGRLQRVQAAARAASSSRSRVSTIRPSRAASAAARRRGSGCHSRCRSPRGAAVARGRRDAHRRRSAIAGGGAVAPFTAAGRARSGKASTRSPSSSGRSSAAGTSFTRRPISVCGTPSASIACFTVASRACVPARSRWARGRKAFSSSWKRKVAVAMRAVWHRAPPRLQAPRICLTPASRSEGAGNGSRIYRAG